MPAVFTENNQPLFLVTPYMKIELRIVTSLQLTTYLNIAIWQNDQTAVCDTVLSFDIPTIVIGYSTLALNIVETPK